MDLSLCPDQIVRSVEVDKILKINERKFRKRCPWTSATF